MMMRWWGKRQQGEKRRRPLHKTQSIVQNIFHGTVYINFTTTHVSHKTLNSESTSITSSYCHAIPLLLMSFFPRQNRSSSKVAFSREKEGATSRKKNGDEMLYFWSAVWTHILISRQRKEHTGIEEKCTTAIKVDVLVATTVMYSQIEYVYWI